MTKDAGAKATTSSADIRTDPTINQAVANRPDGFLRIALSPESDARVRRRAHKAQEEALTQRTKEVGSSDRDIAGHPSRKDLIGAVDFESAAWASVKSKAKSLELQGRFESLVASSAKRTVRPPVRSAGLSL